MFLLEIRIKTVYEDDSDSVGSTHCFMEIVQVPLDYASFLGDSQSYPYKKKYSTEYYTTKQLVETFLTDAGIILDDSIDVQLKLIE